MTRLFILIGICLVSFLVIKFLIRITSFVIKSIIWLVIVGAGVYIVNYFVLPKFNKKPYDIETKFVEPIKKSTKKIVSDIDKKVIPETKKIKKFVTEKINKKTK